jgi:predicted porin
MKNSVRRLASIAFGVTACMAGSSHAQSFVTLYGVIDTFIESTNAGHGLTTRMGSSGFYASRLGVKGSEDLGGGNRINFTLESGINTNNGSAADPTALFNRQAWVGIAGNWGEFRMGRQNTPQFLLISRFDAFGGATMASGLDNLATYSFRVSNSFSYQTPVIAGFKVQVLYGLSQSAAPENGHNNIHISVEYARGPVFLAANYEKLTNAAATDVQRDMFAGGSYDFGSVKLFVAYHHAQDTAKVYDKDVYAMSAQYRVTQADFVSAGYAYANDRLPAGNNAAEISLMVQHLLSKRTMIYATLSHISNHNQAAYTMLGAATQGVSLSHPGFDPTGVQLGVLHFF